MAGRLLALVLILAGAVGGCAPSDAEMRNEVREGVLASCLEAGRSQAAPPGLDWQLLCGCVTDRLTEGRSGEELKAQAPSEEERREAVALCRAEAGTAAAR
jgi:hypothetical protein